MSQPMGECSVRNVRKNGSGVRHSDARQVKEGQR
jgi:hypothetical protein